MATIDFNDGSKVVFSGNSTTVTNGAGGAIMSMRSATINFNSGSTTEFNNNNSLGVSAVGGAISNGTSHMYSLPPSIINFNSGSTVIFRNNLGTKGAALHLAISETNFNSGSNIIFENNFSSAGGSSIYSYVYTFRVDSGSVSQASYIHIEAGSMVTIRDSGIPIYLDATVSHLNNSYISDDTAIAKISIYRMPVFEGTGECKIFGRAARNKNYGINTRAYAEYWNSGTMVGQISHIGSANIEPYETSGCLLP